MAQQDDSPSHESIEESDSPPTSVPAQSEDFDGTKIDGDAIRAKVDRVFELVPEIGTRWRWYDIPYRLLHWSLSSWRHRRLHWRLRHRLNNALNFFISFNEYDRLKVEPLDDPMENLIVPVEEEVIQGGIWLVEVFPPSHFASLDKALKRNGWNKQNVTLGLDAPNAEQIAMARRRSGFMWRRLGAVANPNSSYVPIDADREALPREFATIELTAVQVGSSLTAVFAFVSLSSTGEKMLNNVWTDQHEPSLELQGFKRPRVEGRYFAAQIATQRERQRIHDLARSWFANKCAGFFAGTELGHPVVDLNLFSSYDPFANSDSREWRDALRALGMEGNGAFNYVSPQLPGLRIVRGEALSRPSEPLRNCWGLVGAHQVVADGNDRPGYGDKPYDASTVAFMINETVRSFLLHASVTHYTDQVRATLSDARDTARTRHRTFKPAQVENLKNELLSTSLDLPVMARDAALLWGTDGRRWHRLEVVAEPTPFMAGHAEPFDVIEEFGTARDVAFRQLLDEDEAYRGVLATTSALGASAASARLGRRALTVSFTSLLVSITTLAIANGSTLWRHLQDWLPGV